MLKRTTNRTTEGGLMEKSRNQTNKLMKTAIVIYDQTLADASAGLGLCFYQNAGLGLDIEQGMEKIAKSGIRTIEDGNCRA